MQWKLLGIINVDFDAAGQLLIKCTAFVKYFRKNGNTTKKCIGTFIDFKNAYDSVRREILYNILIDFGIPMVLVGLIKICLPETYSKVRVGKNLSDTFPIRNGLKQGDTLSPLHFTYALGYAIRRVQVNQNDLKLYSTHQLLIYAVDVNKLRGSVHTIKENAETLELASKKIGLEVNIDKSKYMVISRDQNAG
jgi:hypothetical protein